MASLDRTMEKSNLAFSLVSFVYFLSLFASVFLNKLVVQLSFTKFCLQKNVVLQQKIEVSIYNELENNQKYFHWNIYF